MARISKGNYVNISRVIVKILFRMNCFGKGSACFQTIKSGFKKHELEKLHKVLEALIRQEIVLKKKKEHGWKYYLNTERLDKIREIIREKGRKSIIPILLSLS